jgi:hypothetical protein
MSGIDRSLLALAVQHHGRLNTFAVGIPPHRDQGRYDAEIVDSTGSFFSATCNFGFVNIQVSTPPHRNDL